MHLNAVIGNPFNSVGLGLLGMASCRRLLPLSLLTCAVSEDILFSETVEWR